MSLRISPGIMKKAVYDTAGVAEQLVGITATQNITGKITDKRIQLLKTTSVDFKTVAATKVLDMGNDVGTFSCVLFAMVVIGETINAPNGDGAFTLGTNGASYDDINAFPFYPTGSTAGLFEFTDITFPASNNAVLNGASNDLYVNVTTGDSGTTATMSVQIWGMLF